MKLRNLLIVGLLMAAMPLWAQPTVECWERFELSFTHAAKGNPFDVELSATFTNGERTITVRGFYDGDDTYRIRFMPTAEGTWSYTTKSEVRAMNRQRGTLIATAPTGDNHGMVSAKGLGFVYADGTRYMPFGTTNYALAQFRPQTQEKTIETLSKTGFNKTRFCILPKDFPCPEEEPMSYPFVLKSRTKGEQGKDRFEWDVTRFDTDYFKNLDHRIEQLMALGIEADLILFHPYDRGMWGLDALSNEEHIRYLEYLIARVGAYRNVWWSLANEWDLVKTKKREDWVTLTRAVVAADPYRHLCSIHGGTAVYFDYWMPEYTHVSIQDEGPVFTSTASATLRQIYRKPVICDEIGYEGNIKERWARLSPQQMTYFVSNGLLGGIYVTHGECYRDPAEKEFIYWSDGGELKGESWRRIAFLRTILEEAPNAPMMADISRDEVTSTCGEGYYLVNMGKTIQSAWRFNLPRSNGYYRRPTAGTKYKVEIINLWEMTVTEYPVVFEATEVVDYRVYDKFHRDVRLPDAPYLVLRITKIE